LLALGFRPWAFGLEGAELARPADRQRAAGSIGPAALAAYAEQLAGGERTLLPASQGVRFDNQATSRCADDDDAIVVARLSTPGWLDVNALQIRTRDHVSQALSGMTRADDAVPSCDCRRRRMKRHQRCTSCTRSRPCPSRNLQVRPGAARRSCFANVRVFLAFAIVPIAAPAAAQSLADVAARELARRAAIKEPAKVITEKDLPITKTTAGGPAPASADAGKPVASAG